MNYVFLCVGSNKVVCDSFAGFVGSHLKQCNIKCYVYGNICNPINALNLDYYLKMIEKYHNNDKIFVIDTRIIEKGKTKLSFNKGKLEVASLNNKRSIGDYNITLDVPYKELSNITIDYVIKKARKTCELIKLYF